MPCPGPTCSQIYVSTLISALNISLIRYHHHGYSACQLLFEAYNFPHREVHAAFVGGYTIAITTRAGVECIYRNYLWQV